MKNGFVASQKSFPLRRQPVVITIYDKPLTLLLEMRKTFDSPLANHFSAVMQISECCFALPRRKLKIAAALSSSDLLNIGDDLISHGRRSEQPGSLGKNIPCPEPLLEREPHGVPDEGRFRRHPEGQIEHHGDG